MKLLITLIIIFNSIFYSSNSSFKNLFYSAENSINYFPTKVISYKDIFKTYYDIVESRIKTTDKITKNFDTFLSDYYRFHENNIAEYTYKFANENNVIIDDLNQYPDNNRSSSDDEDYILSSTTYSYTPLSEFKREPHYYQPTFNLSLVQNGDIVYETATKFSNLGHNALVVDASHTGYYGTYIQTIEAVGGGVQYGFLDDQRMVEFQVYILRVSGADSTAVSTAISFMVDQLGESYFLHFGIQTDGSIPNQTWYCSELVYAAYYNASINLLAYLDENNSIVNPNPELYFSITPQNIYDCCLTFSIIESEYSYIKISLVSFSNYGYTFSFYNDSPYDIVACYNSKLCFLGDAQSWSNLYDTQTLYLDSGVSTSIFIRSNWFADTVTISYYVPNHYQMISALQKEGNSNFGGDLKYNTLYCASVPIQEINNEQTI